jgi:CheY-like chemotaxis protein
VIAEDDAETVLLMRHALKKAGVSERLHFLPNGVSLMRYLGGHNEFSDRTFYRMPDLIIMDLKMPFFDALQTLPTLKTEEQTAHIPVYIYSDEKDPVKVAAAYRAGASAFFVKPTDLSDIAATLQLMIGMQPSRFNTSRFYLAPP